MSWCVDEPHSHPQRKGARLLGFNYPAPCPIPSNTVHLPAGSLLPSIPDKPEISVPLIRFGRKQKKYHPFFQSSPNQKKGWAAVWSNQNSRREGRTAAGTRATKKTGEQSPPALNSRIILRLCLVYIQYHLTPCYFHCKQKYFRFGHPSFRCDT